MADGYINEAMLEAVGVLRSLDAAWEADDSGQGWEDAAVLWPFLAETTVDTDQLTAMGMAKLALTLLESFAGTTGRRGVEILDAICLAQIMAEDEPE